jgi:alkylhydroperoxidase family enzyme
MSPGARSAAGVARASGGPAFIGEPARIGGVLGLGIGVAERVVGRRLLPARLLAWYPRAAIGSGVLEALVAHEDGRMTPRMLMLIRMSASHAAACPFCVDMNSYRHHEVGITDQEADGVRGDPDAVPTFTERERVAIRYARAVSSTPLRFDPELVAQARAQFSERELVVLVSTAAQVNYWARLIQGLGIPPAGFSDPEQGSPRRRGLRRRAGSPSGAGRPPA